MVKYGHQIRLNPVSSTTPQPAVKHTSSRQTSPKTRYKYKENVIQAIAVNRRPIKLSSIDAYQHQPTQQQQSLHEQGLSGYNTIQVISTELTIVFSRTAYSQRWQRQSHQTENYSILISTVSTRTETATTSIATNSSVKSCVYPISSVQPNTRCISSNYS